MWLPSHVHLQEGTVQSVPPIHALLCVFLDYPWRWSSTVTINSALIKWIYLPDFYTIPNSKNLMGESH